MADRQPGRAALKIPRGRTATGSIDYLVLSFAELESEVEAWRRRLESSGIRRGDRTLVMVRQGLPLIASVFALFAMGAVPVVIDPGMGLRRFLQCVRQARPVGLVGIPLARWISRLAWGSFRSLRARVTAPSSLVARCSPPVPAGSRLGAGLVDTAPDELAAVLFTSGSTGAPKGVCYTHGLFDAQVELIRVTYRIEPGEVDLPLLPIFALFNPALGMTTVVPEIDPRRPAEVDPEKILQAIQQEQVTNSFGSPTLWRKIAARAKDRGVTLPSLRRVLCAGAPVPPSLWEDSLSLLPGGELHSPYGATEALPISTIGAREVMAETLIRTREGAGSCVGRPVAGVSVKVIALTDDPILSESVLRACAPGEIGELVAAGPSVTRTYDGLPEATARAKIPGGPTLPTGAVWHRMGDCGYLDDQGRIWFCGRKVERVQTAAGPLYTEQIEPLMNQHPAVRRSALVGVGPVGRQRPVLVVEVNPGQRADRALADELEAFARRHPLTSRLEAILFHPGLPVDVRHNAKIHRLTLARWAARQRV